MIPDKDLGFPPGVRGASAKGPQGVVASLGNVDGECDVAGLFLEDVEAGRHRVAPSATSVGLENGAGIIECGENNTVGSDMDVIAGVGVELPGVGMGLVVLLNVIIHKDIRWDFAPLDEENVALRPIDRVERGPVLIVVADIPVVGVLLVDRDVSSVRVAAVGDDVGESPGLAHRRVEGLSDAVDQDDVVRLRGGG